MHTPMRQQFLSFGLMLESMWIDAFSDTSIKDDNTFYRFLSEGVHP